MADIAKTAVKTGRLGHWWAFRKPITLLNSLLTGMSAREGFALDCSHRHFVLPGVILPPIRAKVPVAGNFMALRDQEASRRQILAIVSRAEARRRMHVQLGAPGIPGSVALGTSWATVEGEVSGRAS